MILLTSGVAGIIVNPWERFWRCAMSRAIEEMHELSKDMYAAGTIDKHRMLE